MSPKSRRYTDEVMDHIISRYHDDLKIRYRKGEKCVTFIWQVQSITFMDHKRRGRIC